MLEIDGLFAGYATARVLNGVSLDVGDRQVVALLGRNGMGKTTLLRAICGLRPPIVTGGRIRLDGMDLAGLKSHEIARRGVSLVPQGRRVFRDLTVEENLRIGAGKPRDGGWDVERVYGLFPRLAERRGQMGATLSGGEQQMLAIGRSLMTDAALLIMDEPTEGLAPAVRDVILDRLRDVGRSDHTILIAEQNVDFALALADVVAVIGESGTIEWSGTADGLRQDESILHSLIGL